MSGRWGHGSHRHRPRDRQDDFPPLPAPRLPSLRTLNSPRQRDNSEPSTSRTQGQPRYWSAAYRRAERIRSLEGRNTGTEEFENTDNGWPTRANRLRNVEMRASDFEDLDRSLDEANSHLRALLDLTTHNHLTPLMPPPFSPPLRSHDGPEDNRRSKRRKLDSEKHVPSYTGFRYGKYGQVEPGQLQMEMVSCDGGMFSNETLYAAENILKDDNSVYCTKGNRCNIVLRHQGATVFTLQELIIKAPGSMNYSHP